MFLSGPPDYGAGQLDTGRYGEQYASKREDADRALLPEQTPFYKDLVILSRLVIIFYIAPLEMQMLTAYHRLLLLFKQVFVWTFLLLQMNTQIWLPLNILVSKVVVLCFFMQTWMILLFHKTCECRDD